jgi:hypothetical protein
VRTLAAYDLLILRRGAAAAFSSKRDLLLIVLALPVLLLMAAEGFRNSAAALAAAPAPLRLLAAAATALAANLAILRRLDHLRADSIVAHAALRPAAAAGYAAAWNAVPLAGALALLLAAVPTLASALLAAAAYGLGAGAAAVARRIAFALRRSLQRRRTRRGPIRPLPLGQEARRSRIAALVAARAGFPGLSLRANLFALAALGALVAAAGAGLPTPSAAPAAPAAALLFAALIPFALLLRQQAALLRYLLFLGVTPAWPALVPLALAGALIGGFAVTAAAAGGAPAALAAGAAIALASFAVLALIRAFHFATRPRRTAELSIQVDLVALVVASVLTPMLAPALLAFRLFALHRRAAAMKHLAP